MATVFELEPIATTKFPLAVAILAKLFPLTTLVTALAIALLIPVM